MVPAQLDSNLLDFFGFLLGKRCGWYFFGILSVEVLKELR